MASSRPRNLIFPDDRCFGTLLIRPAGQPLAGGWPHWEELGYRQLAPARGEVMLPAGTECMLLLEPATARLGVGLEQLRPDGLDAIEIEAVSGDVRLSDRDLESIGRLIGLIWLDLHGTQITDAGLASTCRLRALRHLNLTWATGISDTGVGGLGALTALEKLFAGGNALTDAAFSGIAALDNLRELRLDSRAITDAGISRLKQCAKLERLHCPPGVSTRGLEHLAGLPLTHLDLARNDNIDDIALYEMHSLLEGWTNLQSLNLAGNPIGDNGLKHLSSCAQLRELNLEETEVSPMGLLKLRSVLGKCEVRI